MWYLNNADKNYITLNDTEVNEEQLIDRYYSFYYSLQDLQNVD